MKKIYIVNYCSPGCVPLKSVTQIDELYGLDMIFVPQLFHKNTETYFWCSVRTFSFSIFMTRLRNCIKIIS